MGSKTVMMNTKTTEIAGDDLTPVKPTATLGIQSDTAFSEASKRLCGRDLCSIADLTVQEMAAIMELAHAVKNHLVSHIASLSDVIVHVEPYGGPMSTPSPEASAQGKPAAR